MKMKTPLRLFSTVLVLLLVATTTFSQTAAEKKAMKKELKMYKKMKPIQVRQMKLNYEAKLRGMDDLSQKVKECNSGKDSLQSLMSSLQSRNSTLEMQLTDAQKTAANAQKGVAKGFYYRVQLGAYKQFDIKGKLNKADDTILAETKDGMDKYVVGLFLNLDEADSFKKDMAKMGIKDAWVVAYKDGIRITHAEAKAGIEAQKAAGGAVKK
jgi:hypothetical protein